VLKLAPALLESEKVPLAARDALLGVLYRLDLFDALAEYIGNRPPFKVLELMQGVAGFTYEDLGFRSPPEPARIPAAFETLFTPDRKIRGVNLHPAGENPYKLKNFDMTVVVASEPSLAEMANEDDLALESMHPAGPGGRRLTLWIHGLNTQLYVYLTPKGYKNGIFLRFRKGEYHGLTHATRMALTLRGPLAEPSRWTMVLKRFIVPSGRLYFGVTGVAAEELPR
jgi:hypothetical protein